MYEECMVRIFDSQISAVLGLPVRFSLLRLFGYHLVSLLFVYLFCFVLHFCVGSHYGIMKSVSRVNMEYMQ